MPSSEHRTVSSLIRRFRAAGIDPRRKLGQNFLIDLNLHDLLLRTALLSSSDVVLEVGTGTGALTVAMAEQAGTVVTVELDPVLAAMAAEQLHAMANVRLIQTDALANKNRVHPAVLDAVDELLAAAPDRRFKLVANLPYNIATPLVTNLLALDRPPASMTVTIQKELAERVVARPGTKDYGALAIWVQSQCRAEIVRILPPSVFWPRPKVDSAIIHIELDPTRRAAIGDLGFFHQFVRAMFFHRRKYLRSELVATVKGRLDKPAVDEILRRLALSPTARAEMLDVSSMLTLAEAVRAEVGD